MTWIEVAHLRLNLKNKTEVKKQKLASLKLAKEKHQEKEGALAGYSSANSQLLSVSFFLSQPQLLRTRGRVPG